MAIRARPVSARALLTCVVAPAFAVGDIHGDLLKAIRSLEVAGVLGEDDGRPLWVGGDATVVQLGDVLDRGDCEIGARPSPRSAAARQGSHLRLRFLLAVVCAQPLQPSSASVRSERVVAPACC